MQTGVYNRKGLSRTRKIRGALSISILALSSIFLNNQRFDSIVLLLRQNIVHVISSPQSTNKDVKTVNTQKDRCTPNGDVCLYNHICYDVESEQWQSSQQIVGQPLLNNLGLNNRYEHQDDQIHQAFGKCNEKFQPVHSDEEKIKVINMDSTEDILFIDGATYHVCCFFDHFGHTLMNLVLPAFHALVKIGFVKERLNSIKYLLEDRTPFNRPDTAIRTFPFFAGSDEKVLLFNKLQDEAKVKEQRYVCFEQLVVGMYHDSLVSLGGATEGNQMEVGMLQPVKDHLTKLYPTTPESIEFALNETLISVPTNSSKPPECTITLLKRQTRTRAIVNIDETKKLIQNVFSPKFWNFQQVAFEGKSSFLSQYMTMQSTALFISVSGTGSHLSMFLPDGCVNLQVEYCKQEDYNNKFMCAVSPSLHCLTSSSEATFGKSCALAKKNNVTVDLVDLRHALQKAHDQLWTRCQIKSLEQDEVD